MHFQKALATAMSEGNRNPEGFRTGERSPPGRGALPPILCRPEGRKGMEADVNAAKLSQIWKRLKQACRLLAILVLRLGAKRQTRGIAASAEGISGPGRFPISARSVHRRPNSSLRSIRGPVVYEPRRQEECRNVKIDMSNGDRS